jgi:hypothetical protein
LAKSRKRLVTWTSRFATLGATRLAVNAVTKLLQAREASGEAQDRLEAGAPVLDGLRNPARGRAASRPVPTTPGAL